MDLWQLHIFCRVIEYRSFSKAAEAVHLSQPTVSTHIKELEGHFGCPLIDRLTKEAVPTQAGRLLYGYARRLLGLRDEAESAMSQVQGKTRGRLVIGGSTIPGTYLLPRVVGRFRARYPDVRVGLTIKDTAGILSGISEGILELGVVGAESDERDIRQEPLLEEEMRLIVPRGHRWDARRKVPLAELWGEPYIARESGSGTFRSLQERIRELKGAKGELNVIAEMGSTEAVRQGIKEGIGVSILSPLAVAEDIAAGRLKALPVDGLNLTRRFLLTTHRRRSLSPLAAAFIELLKAEMGV
jgi:DNA-binding transcriptional LysR family regulator